MNERRTAVIVTDGKKVLVCHAPNKKDKPNTWDLPKGHCNGEESFYDCGQRELLEETGIVKEELTGSVISLSTEKPIPYNGDQMSLTCLLTDELPETDTLKCTSYFEWHGEQFQEVNEYAYVDIEKLDIYLYHSIVKQLLPTIKEIIVQAVKTVNAVGISQYFKQ